MKHKILFWFLILIELVIVIILGWKIYKLNNNLGGLLMINEMTNKYTHKNVPETKLNYYYELKPKTIINKEIEWPPYKVTYTINADGLHDRLDYTIHKSKETYRIIALGDSYTYGLNINTKDNFTEQLEVILNNITCKSKNTFEVINLGVWGYDLQYSLERFTLKGKKYTPDLIIWFIKQDDFLQINEILTPKENECINKGKNLLRSNRIIKKELASYLSNCYQKSIKDLIKTMGGNQEVARYDQKIINQLRQEYNGNLILMTFNDLQKEYRNILVKMTKTNPKTYLLEIPDFRTDKTTFFYPYDLHPNKKGYQIMTQKIYSYLIEKKLLPCN